MSEYQIFYYEIEIILDYNDYDGDNIFDFECEYYIIEFGIEFDFNFNFNFKYRVNSDFDFIPKL